MVECSFRALATILPVALAACDAPASSITWDRGDEESAVVVATGEGSESTATIDTPGLSTRVSLPSSLLRSSRFEVGGVGLYPGSKVESVAVRAPAAAGDKRPQVDVAFTSPAAPAVIRDWLRRRFEARGGTVSEAGGSLEGRTADGDHFVIELAPDGAGTRGTIRVRERPL